MYRNTAQIPGGNLGTTTLLTPPLEKTRDRTDPEVSRALAEKRRQIDDQIANFKTLKEREFQDFEKDLLRQRQRRKREASKPKHGSSLSDKAKSSDALGLLGVLNQSNSHMNGSLDRQKERSAEGNIPSQTLLPQSKPTLSLDKLNINGETTPPLTAEGSPPSSALCLKHQITRSPPNQSLSLTPPRIRPHRLDQAQLTPPTPSRDQNSNNFVGIFSPAYLPLLESRDDDIQVRKYARSGSFSLTQSTSGSASISPISRKDRALTAPLLPSNSLPSALRTASGTTLRKRKHVTFQLADSAIVEPSSSYEEGPSPMLEGDLDFDEKIDEIVDDGHHVAEESEEEVTSGLTKRNIRSPMITPKALKVPLNEDILSPRSALEVSVEGDNGIGFFELDEELASTGFQSHDTKFIDDDIEDVEKSAELRREDGEGDDDEKWEIKKPMYEYSGSVPINIVRSTGSWVGSFGH